MIHWCGDGSGNYHNVLATEALTGVHNSSMGDFELIIRQIDQVARVNAEQDRKIVYFKMEQDPLAVIRAFTDAA